MMILIFGSLMYFIAKEGESQQLENSIASIQNAPSNLEEGFTIFTQLLVHNIESSIGILLFQIITILLTCRLFGWLFQKIGQPTVIGEIVAGNPGIIAFVPSKFIEKDFPGHLLKDESISFDEVFAGKEWFPTATPAPQFGFLPLITGTLWVSFFAILFALPFGLSVAVYMSEVADHRTRSFLKPVIELLSGIPSVVYGFFGLIVIVPLIQENI